MDDIFSNMLDEGWLVIYMDDILIFSKDATTHRERMRRVLQHLQENDLYLKPEKCIFESQKVEFLGLVLSPGTVEMDPVKIAGVTE